LVQKRTVPTAIWTLRVSLGAANRLIPVVAAATRHKKSGAKTYPRPLQRIYLFAHPALATEGCLYSIFRCGAGSGGRGMTLRWRCDEAARRSKPQPSRRACRAPPGPVMAAAGDRSQVRRPRPGPIAVDRQPSNSQGEAGCLKWEVHRGRCGASLQHRARDALGFGGLAALRTSASLGVARRRGPRVRALLVAHAAQT
jgi:hypothetical protein